METAHIVDNLTSLKIISATVIAATDFRLSVNACNKSEHQASKHPFKLTCSSGNLIGVKMQSVTQTVTHYKNEINLSPVSILQTIFIR